MKNAISPHVHLQSLDSASTPEAFAAKEVELGTGALTCTDHGTLACTYKAYDLAKKNNLIFCAGLEFYSRDDNCPILTKNGIAKTSTIPRGADKDKWKIEHPTGSFYDYAKYYHGTLGLRDFKAYKAAVRLLSKADARSEVHGSQRKPIFGWPEIEELATYNTTLGSSCLGGLVARHLTKEDASQETKISIAKDYFEHLLHLYKERFYVEVFPHVCDREFIKGVFIEVEHPSGTKETLKYSFDKTIRTNVGDFKAEIVADSKQKHEYLISVSHYRIWTDFEAPLKILSIEKKEGFVQNACCPWSPNGDVQFGANVFMLGMAKKYNVPILCSDDAHFTDPKAKMVQDVRLSQQGGWRFYGSYHRKSSSEAFEHFNQKHNISESVFEGWVENSYSWAQGFKDFKFDSTPQLPTKFFPKDTLGFTKELINKVGRMPKNDPRYIERVKKELEILHKNGSVDLLPYFHLANEVCTLYQNQGELMNVGRGSAAGCLLSYLLGITHLDPIKHDLSLERFITKTRIVSNRWPDIDLDFNSRDLLVGYATNIVEFEAEDGKKVTVPEDFKLETDQGLLTAREALDKSADIKPWWTNEDQSNNQ